VAVFLQIDDKEILRRIQSSYYFQSDQRETHFYLKYLKYEVIDSVKYEISYLVFSIWPYLRPWGSFLPRLNFWSNWTVS
jgi:hypothetical protein